MDTNVQAAPAPQAPVVAPTPAPTPTPPVAAPVVVDTPIMQDGGSVSSNKDGFFNSLNWMEVGFAVLGVTALLYATNYYRFKVKQDKMVNNEMQRNIDELKMNLQGLMKGKYKPM
jgi:hypothetical protein